MPIIKVSEVIKQDKNKVYAIIKDMGKFPEFMRYVKELKVLERAENRLVTSWNVEIDGANILWREEDIFSDEQMSLKFKMLQGDYNRYEGEWRLEDVPGGTKVTIVATFDWGGDTSF